TGADIFRRTIELLLLLAIAVSAFFLAAPFVAFSNEGRESSVPAERKKNILIVGKSDRKAYLDQVLLGAEKVSKKNEAAVTVYTGKSNAEEISMQALFNYASYLNADGIIACIEDDDERLDIPRKTNGEPIPLVTIGSYAPNLPQLSYIGANYSELGKITAREITEQIGPGGKVILLESNAASDTNHSNLMSGLLGALSSHPEISVKTLQFERESSFSKEDNLRQQLASQEGLELIVSLAEQTTILAAQSVRDLNLSGKVKLIGFGDSDDCRADFEKKIVTELISVKTQDIGRRAMTELFEFLQNGYANSFVSAEVEVLKEGGE
ncbi:MAG: substrate-binding domain-containing protein, partial [Treponema sp.]|nr:substrate-binding domain-containing protein [Treponema sp.]